jgi:hypothetical protein
MFSGLRSVKGRILYPFHSIARKVMPYEKGKIDDHFI